MKALILDDDFSVRAIMIRMMAALEYNSQACSNVPDALAAAARQKFDVVITDYNLGADQMNGAEFALYLRAHYQDDCPPIILCSGDLGNLDRERLKDVVDAFLQKPVSREEIRAALDKVKKVKIPIS